MGIASKGREMGSLAWVARTEATGFKIGSIPSTMSDADSKWMEAVEKLQTRQSPIDIKQATAKYQDYRPFSLIGHENLSISAGTLTATNTGTTIKCLARPDTALLEGGPLNVRYEFVEMHFHWELLTTRLGQNTLLTVWLILWSCIWFTKMCTTLL